jgi:hypothetical protein
LTTAKPFPAIGPRFSSNRHREKEHFMATRLYGISRGEGQEQIFESVGAATADDMELTIDLDSGLTREEVVVLLDRITRHILEHDFPPA